MYNLGRGMWRRVGDFERLRAPQIEKQLKIQQYLAFIEFQKKRHDYIQSYRNSILQNKMAAEVLEPVLEPVLESVLEPVLEPVLESVLEPLVSEIDSIISIDSEVVNNIEEPYVKIMPKKKRKKNK